MEKDFIRIVDYERYLTEYSIPEWEKRSEENKAKYEAAKKKYESKILAKLFGWKYENSLECVGAWWDFNEGAIEERKLELKRCEYHLFTLQEELIQSKLDIYDSFYKWCSDNNI